MNTNEHGTCFTRRRKELQTVRKALRLWSKMEHLVANCEEHDAEYAAENCERCFPHCDRARLALREACDVLGIEVL